ncbi:hypothetical protein BJX70DRAFT_312854 [Aspergillus crustosus]
MGRAELFFSAGSEDFSLDESLEVPGDNIESPYDQHFLPTSVTDFPSQSVPSTLLGPGSLDEELLKWVLQPALQKLDCNVMKYQVLVKEEITEQRGSIDDLQAHLTLGKADMSNTALSLKQTAAPSRVEKKTTQRKRPAKMALAPVGLSSAGNQSPRNVLGSILDRNLLRKAPCASAISVTDGETVTLIQSMYKACVGKSLSASQALSVKTAGTSPVSLGFAEFINAVSSLRINDCNQSTFQIPAYSFKSLREASVAYYKVLWPGENIKWKPESPADFIRQRIVQVLLHLTYQDFVSEISEREKDGSLAIDRQGRPIQAVAHDWILQDAYGCMDTKGLRKYISEECRWGDRWWRIASNAGLGVLLLASDQLAKHVYIYLLWNRETC